MRVRGNGHRHARGVTGPHGASQGAGCLRLGKEEACCPAQPSCVLGSEHAPRGRRGAWLPAPCSVELSVPSWLCPMPPACPAVSCRPPRTPGGALKLLSHRSLLTTSAEPSTWTRPGASRPLLGAAPLPAQGRVPAEFPVPTAHAERAQRTEPRAPGMLPCPAGPHRCPTATLLLPLQPLLLLPGPPHPTPAGRPRWQLRS